MVLVNTESIEGKKLETLGLVRGSVAQTKHIGKDIMAGFKNIIGGEIKGYTDMLNEARNTANQRLIEEAEKLGADAIVNIRYETSSVMASAVEIIVYGTAVKFK